MKNNITIEDVQKLLEKRRRKEELVPVELNKYKVVIDSLDNKRANYTLKNNLIEYHSDIDVKKIDIYDYFRLIFERKGELPFEDLKRPDEDYTKGKYNAICVQIETAQPSKNHIITKDLNKLDDLIAEKFVITSPVTYIGRNRNSKNARNLYGFTFDVDGVGKNQMIDILHQMNTKHIPTANIIVNSGNGVHLYYLLEEPISLFENIKPILKKLKYNLINLIWNSYTSSIKNKQYQGIFQGFRIPESQSKLGEKYPVCAYKTERTYYTIEELNSYIKENKERLTERELETINNAKYIPKKLSLKEAKEKYPDWYERRIVKGEKKGSWNIKRDLYDWWLNKCKTEVKEGHRYFSLMCLAIYALKCNIDIKELENDAYSLFEPMESLTKNEDNHFTIEDIMDSLKAFHENYRTFPRKDIEKLTGIVIPANKRNGRKQAEHIKIMNAIRDIVKPNGEWRNKEGRPKGSGEKKEIVKEWRLRNPQGKKADCIRETGLTKPTVYKWWNG